MLFMKILAHTFKFEFIVVCRTRPLDGDLSVLFGFFDVLEKKWDLFCVHTFLSHFFIQGVLNALFALKTKSPNANILLSNQTMILNFVFLSENLYPLGI